MASGTRRWAFFKVTMSGEAQKEARLVGGTAAQKRGRKRDVCGITEEGVGKEKCGK